MRKFIELTQKHTNVEDFKRISRLLGLSPHTDSFIQRKLEQGIIRGFRHSIQLNKFVTWFSSDIVISGGISLTSEEFLQLLSGGISLTSEEFLQLHKEKSQEDLIKMNLQNTDLVPSDFGSPKKTETKTIEIGEYSFEEPEFETLFHFIDSFGDIVGQVEWHESMVSYTKHLQTCYWNKKGECFIILNQGSSRCVERDLIPIPLPWYKDKDRLEKGVLVSLKNHYFVVYSVKNTSVYDGRGTYLGDLNETQELTKEEIKLLLS